MALRLLQGFLIALVGAVVAVWLHVPLPWMLGALLLTAATKIAGARTICIRPLRNAGQCVIGLALGLYFTPEVVAHIVHNAWAIAGSAALAILLGLLGTYMLSRWGGVDFTTAYFSSAIGGASEMASLAERHGARVDLVATAHSLRVMMIVVLVPLLFQWSGITGLDASAPGPRAVVWPGLALLAILAISGALLLQWARWPNPWVLGSMVVAILLTANRVELSALPTWVINGGQLLLGWALGDRYRPDFFHAAPRLLKAVMAFTVMAMLLALGFGWLVSWWTSIPTPTAILGTTPGGVAEMSITAKVLQLGAPVVTSFHVSRMAVVLIVTAPLYHVLVKLRKHRERAPRT